jgi:hypothetical protein
MLRAGGGERNLAAFSPRSGLMVRSLALHQYPIK